MMNDRHTRNNSAGIERRHFVASSVAVGLTVLPARTVFSYQQNEKVALGIIGAGGRGQWIADLFVKHGGYRISAVADYFQDRVDAVGKAFNVPEKARFTGLLGYRRLLETRPDAVAIETPSYFHPEQSLASVEAGCHVFLAKPIAVDVPGCLDILRAGQQARQKRLVFLVDFQTRANPLYQEAVRRVHAGDIGPIICAEARYYTGHNPAREEILARDPDNKELQLRYWAALRVLSGDVITEQNIHALDVATWFINADPVKAYGTGGRKGRKGGGDCWDHFAVIFYFPGDIVLSFSSKQLGTGYETIACRVFGPDGTADTDYWRSVSIAGRKPFEGGSVEGLYTTGTEANIRTFYDAIRAGDASNPTVEPSVRSNLTTILGRMAAYRQAEVTWKEMMETAEKWEYDTRGLKE
ncbi:MAG: Gfo/Idh/MocA family oxidoreductase [Thermoguttaceae bacterium]|nr:Gfo/Idh/MocA family oxidoreductase [Thermoguttaceae bacterium]MDW8079358.1 Gfo/Idh/MocA family oxidoreductase [Thermoguttaceae bacterium]